MFLVKEGVKNHDRKKVDRSRNNSITRNNAWKIGL